MTARGVCAGVIVIVMLSTVDRMKQRYLSSIVVIALLARVSQAYPLLLWSSSSSGQLAGHDLIDALERVPVLRTSLKNAYDDDDVMYWRRYQRSEPPDWLGTQAAGTAWDAYDRILRQQQPRRTANPVNFLGKRAIFFT